VGKKQDNKWRMSAPVPGEVLRQLEKQEREEEEEEKQRKMRRQNRSVSASGSIEKQVTNISPPSSIEEDDGEVNNNKNEKNGDSSSTNVVSGDKPNAKGRCVIC